MTSMLLIILGALLVYTAVQGSKFREQLIGNVTGAEPSQDTETGDPVPQQPGKGEKPKPI